MEALFCFDERYEQHFGAAVTSLMLNNTEHLKKVHMVTGKVSERLNQKIAQLKNQSNVDFLFYEVDDNQVRDLKVSRHISSAAYYRLLAPEMLPQDLDKIIYLDSDLIVNKSINELFNYDLSDYIIAAYAGEGKSVTTKKRLQLQGDYYFNSGVMLINVKAWRSQNIGEQCIKFIRENPELVLLWDQDALNKIIDGNLLRLDRKWNSLVDLFAGTSNINEESRIIHYIGSLKPWQSWCLAKEKEIYWSYLKKSPWSDCQAEIPDSPKKLLAAIKSLLKQLKNTRK
jgi:lipopolysaccharide biosynthesis glycosyltransferase